MSNVLIRRCFETRLKTWAAAQVPPIPVAYENAPFTAPAANARYIRSYILPGNTDSRGIERKHREYVGVFQVSVVLPTNNGTRPAVDIAQSLESTFPPGAPMVQDGLSVWLQAPMSMAPAIQEPDHYVVPVSVAYRAEVFV